jgi:CarD family transcriptional regulator
MFKVGEKVVYPAHGVGEIEAIRSHVISGTERRFYMLRILETDMKIMIPIDNVESVGLRKIIDRAMVTKVWVCGENRNGPANLEPALSRNTEIKPVRSLRSQSLARSFFEGDSNFFFGERKMLDSVEICWLGTFHRALIPKKIMDELRHIFTTEFRSQYPIGKSRGLSGFCFQLWRKRPPSSSPPARV